MSAAKSERYGMRSGATWGRAVQSMVSDIQKHPETRIDPRMLQALELNGTLAAMAGDVDRVKRWIDAI